MVLKEFQVSFRTLFRKVEKIVAEIRRFLTNLVLKKTSKTKKNLAENHFDNLLRVLDLLPNFPFTTSETMAKYY